MLDEMIVEIRSMRTLGISEQNIFDSINYDIEHQEGIFSRLKGDLERSADKLITRTVQSERVNELLSESVAEGEEISLSEVLYVWQLDPTVIEHCDDCSQNSGMESKTLIEWQSIGIPGSGNTICGDYCRCILVPEKSESPE
jgi:hypothetical protein